MAHRALPGLGVAGDVAPGVAVGLVWAWVGEGVVLAAGCGKMLLQAARRKARTAKIKKDFKPVKKDPFQDAFLDYKAKIGDIIAFSPLS